MEYLSFLLIYGGPFVLAGLLILLFAYVTHRVRLKNPSFDASMGKAVRIVSAKRFKETAAVVIVVAVVIVLWWNGYGGDIDNP
ncbi:hypothetical protein J31TS4_15740 [Paenibacillus sp. J31TS4]|uniref:hypothetical protein n=1 Tax=Paenibacillus sp. J31TS4 TaxID=2807195 RepID=UPI001B18E4CE|nr:hypothetical protein [Paenibacillus sp. J31TS4]GIP38294.1 hypothetical protein J31TS4_15740 [Paenibacillus sp. J31TS4]